MSEKDKGARGGGRTEAVAAQTGTSLPEGVAAAPTADAPEADFSTCADCGSSEVVYVTTDPAAEQKAYCAKDLPANVTQKMVEEQGRG